MRLILHRLYVIPLLSLVAAFPAHAGRTNYHRLHPLWQRDVPNIILFDADRDGTDEAAILRGSQMDVMDWKLETYYHSFSIQVPGILGCLPIPDTRLDSLRYLAGFREDDTLRFSLILPAYLNDKKTPLIPLLRYGRHPDTKPAQFYESVAFRCMVNDGRGKTTALFSENTTHDPHGKRGLIAFDPSGWNKVWTFEFGPQVSDLEVSDLDGDGAEEIIVGTYAPDNGLSIGGIADNGSWLFVVKHDGRLMWKAPIGPRWTGVAAAAADLTGWGDRKIVALQYSNGASDGGQDRVMVFNPADGRLLAERKVGNRFTVPASQHVEFVRDLNGDGRDEIVLGNTDGIVRVLDASLTTIRNSESYGRPVKIAVVEDLDADGIPEIVCQIPDERISVLDAALRELCFFATPAAETTILSVVHADKKRHLLLRSESGGTGRFQLLEFQKSIFPFGENAASSAIWIWKAVSGILASALLFLLLFRRRILAGPALRALASSGQADTLLVVNRKGGILHAGGGWTAWMRTRPERIPKPPYSGESASGNLPAIWTALDRSLLEPGRDVSFSVLDPDNSVAVPLSVRTIPMKSLGITCHWLENRTARDRARLVERWAEVAQKLAHGIKNPLTSIRMNTQILVDLLAEKGDVNRGEMNGLLQAVMRQVTKLINLSDGFMRFTRFESPAIGPVDLNSALTGLILEWQPEKAANIKVEWDLGENLPPALVDREQFEQAMKNVFFNAVESIDQNGRILIASRCVHLFERESESMGGAYVEIQVRDNGSGIPPDMLPKVFQPYFTLKREGTGLGLSIVEKIVQGHGGQVHIQSELGAGTTVTLRFKAAPAAGEMA
jgi:nitrogen-specific signal transduction histidine kinase